MCFPIKFEVLLGLKNFLKLGPKLDPKSLVQLRIRADRITSHESQWAKHTVTLCFFVFIFLSQESAEGTIYIGRIQDCLGVAFVSKFFRLSFASDNFFNQLLV